MMFALLLAAAFEKIALVDSLDFARIYDIETEKGSAELVDFLTCVHPTELWWRDKGGARMRYPSREESCPLEDCPFEKRRPPREDTWGYLRLNRSDVDLLALARRQCLAKGWDFGIHTTFEENHWCLELASAWNLAHPQYGCAAYGGVQWMGPCSLAFPEVMEHKLRLVDERLAYRPKAIFLDLWRCAGWSPALEYVEPVIAKWKARHPGEPVPADSWDEIAAEPVVRYFRAFSAKCRAAGVRFYVGWKPVRLANDPKPTEYCVDWGRILDWKGLAAEGVFDGVAPLSVVWSDKDPFGETLRLYRYVREVCGAKADAYFPVSAYDFYRYGIPSYAKATKLSKADVVRRLMGLAWEAGGRGVTFECVDYGNYSDAECRAIAEMLEKFKTVPSGGRESAQP